MIATPPPSAFRCRECRKVVENTKPTAHRPACCRPYSLLALWRCRGSECPGHRWPPSSTPHPDDCLSPSESADLLTQNAGAAHG